MSEKKITVGIIISLVVIVFLASFLGSPKTNVTETTGDYDILTQAKTDASVVDEDARAEFKEISLDEYFELYNSSEESLVFIGSSSCGYSAIAEPIVSGIAYEEKLDIYYLNVYEFSQEEGKRFISSNQKLEDFGTPMLLLVGNESIKDLVDQLTDKRHYLEFLKNNNLIK